jgi:hypothetical protein
MATCTVAGPGVGAATVAGPGVGVASPTRVEAGLATDRLGWAVAWRPGVFRAILLLHNTQE